MRLLAGLYTTQRRFMWRPPRGMSCTLVVYLSVTVLVLCGCVYAVHRVTASSVVLYCGYIVTG